jgi:DNA-binding transcriptional MerR regulator
MSGDRTFKIGEFSRISRVSVKTLRYYDEIGLLTPVRVDRFTGYRYYSADQLPRLNRTLALKDLGLSLEQIAALLDDDLPPAEIRGMLRLKRVEIQQHLEEEQARLARIEARLEQIEQGWLEAKDEREGTPMGMRTCPGCGKAVREPSARSCPYCGAGLPMSPAPLLPIKKPAKEVAKRSISFSLIAIVLIIAMSAIVAVVLRRHEMTIPSLMSGPLPESQPSDPQLALLSVRCEKHARGGQFVFEGQVQNISDSSLQDIVVVVAVYNANPGCVGSDEAPIEHATLQPGQTSPFRVAVDYDPRVAYYKVNFKRRQGDTLPTRDSRSS